MPRTIATHSRHEVFECFENNMQISDTIRKTGYAAYYITDLYMKWGRELKKERYIPEIQVNRFDVEYELKYPWMKHFISLQTTNMDVAIAWNKLCLSTGDTPIKL